jgi:putative endonuclease
MATFGYVYIMTNKNKTTLYIGVTNNLARRVYEHKKHSIKNSFSDRYNLEYCIYYEEFPYFNLAIKREKELKKWSREKKEKLIDKNNPEWKELVNERGFIRNKEAIPHFVWNDGTSHDKSTVGDSGVARVNGQMLQDTAGSGATLHQTGNVEMPQSTGGSRANSGGFLPPVGMTPHCEDIGVVFGGFAAKYYSPHSPGTPVIPNEAQRSEGTLISGSMESRASQRSEGTLINNSMESHISQRSEGTPTNNSMESRASQRRAESPNLDTNDSNISSVNGQMLQDTDGSRAASHQTGNVEMPQYTGSSGANSGGFLPPVGMTPHCEDIGVVVGGFAANYYFSHSPGTPVIPNEAQRSEGTLISGSMESHTSQRRAESPNLDTNDSNIGSVNGQMLQDTVGSGAALHQTGNVEMPQCTGGSGATSGGFLPPVGMTPHCEDIGVVFGGFAAKYYSPHSPGTPVIPNEAQRSEGTLINGSMGSHTSQRSEGTLISGSMESRAAQRSEGIPTTEPLETTQKRNP